MSETESRDLRFLPEEINQINDSLIDDLKEMFKGYTMIRKIFTKDRYSGRPSEALLTREWEYTFTRLSPEYLDLAIVKKPIGNAVSLVEEELDIVYTRVKSKEPLLKHGEIRIGKKQEPPSVNNRDAVVAAINFLAELKRQL